MYRYYKASAVCYASLFDVGGPRESPDIGLAFQDSIWFKRGWTLQVFITYL